MLSVFVVLGVIMLVFTVAQVVPSDPAAFFAGPRPTAALIAKARETLHRDAPLAERFATFARAMATADFGVSYKSCWAISQDLAVYLPATLKLAIFSIVLALLIGMPCGRPRRRPQGPRAGQSGRPLLDHSRRHADFLSGNAPARRLPPGPALAASIRSLLEEFSIIDPVPFANGFMLLDAALAARFDALPNPEGPALAVMGLSFAYALTGPVLVAMYQKRSPPRTFRLSRLRRLW